LDCNASCDSPGARLGHGSWRRCWAAGQPIQLTKTWRTLVPALTEPGVYTLRLEVFDEHWQRLSVVAGPGGRTDQEGRLLLGTVRVRATGGAS